jgi:glucose-1-phosphate cytidylyltransferase
MKTVLFCGGLGTRIRDVSQSLPKPMIPIGDVPILWHLMHYYSQFGHTDFILCLGYKANVIKNYFLKHTPQTYVDCVVNGSDKRIEFLGDTQIDWRITMIDTGTWRNVGERLWAVREHLTDDEMFFANYSDGLCDIDLNEMIEIFRASGKIACVTAVRPSFSLHLLEMGPEGKVERISASRDADLWINGGFFIFRREIFDYLRDGDELVEAPFQRLIEANQLMAFRHEGFWRPMDTLKDKEVLEDLVDNGTMPWILNKCSKGGSVRSREKVG